MNKENKKMAKAEMGTVLEVGVNVMVVSVILVTLFRAIL